MCSLIVCRVSRENSRSIQATNRTCTNHLYKQPFLCITACIDRMVFEGILVSSSEYAVVRSKVLLNVRDVDL
jgi:hypothetical protein